MVRICNDGLAFIKGGLEDSSAGWIMDWVVLWTG